MTRHVTVLAAAVLVLAVAVLVLAGSIVATAQPRPTPLCVLGGTDGIPAVHVPLGPLETCPPGGYLVEP